MQCPNLVELVNSVILLCKAGERPYVPNLFQLGEYCKANSYRECPFLLKEHNHEERYDTFMKI